MPTAPSQVLPDGGRATGARLGLKEQVKCPTLKNGDAAPILGAAQRVLGRTGSGGSTRQVPRPPGRGAHRGGERLPCSGEVRPRAPPGEAWLSDALRPQAALSWMEMCVPGPSTGPPRRGPGSPVMGVHPEDWEALAQQSSFPTRLKTPWKVGGQPAQEGSVRDWVLGWKRARSLGQMAI